MQWYWVAFYLLAGLPAARVAWVQNTAPVPEDLTDARRERLVKLRRGNWTEGRSGPFLTATALLPTLTLLVFWPALAVGFAVVAITHPSQARRAGARLWLAVRHGRLG